MLTHFGRRAPSPLADRSRQTISPGSRPAATARRASRRTARARRDSRLLGEAGENVVAVGRADVVARREHRPDREPAPVLVLDDVELREAEFRQPVVPGAPSARSSKSTTSAPPGKEGVPGTHATVSPTLPPGNRTEKASGTRPLIVSRVASARS